MDPTYDKSPDAAILELKNLALQVEMADNLDELRPLFYQQESFARQYPSDPEIQSLAAEIKQRIAARGMTLKQAAGGSQREPTPTPGTMRAEVQTPSSPIPTHEVPSYEPSGQVTTKYVATPKLEPPPSADTGRPARWRLAYWIPAGVGLLAVVAIVVLASRTRRPPPPPASDLLGVEFQTSPPGAALRIDHVLQGTSNRRVDLTPGSHTVEAVLDGYEPAVTTFEVLSGSSPSVNLTLQARPQGLRFLTDLTNGKVTLDSNPAGELQEGQLTLDGVAVGSHSVRISGEGSEAAFSFELVPGRAPVLRGPIEAKNVLVVLVSNAGNEAVARSSSTPMTVGIDGRAVGQIGPDGLRLNDLQSGDHELSLGARKVVASFGPNPVLTAFLNLDLNAGTLVVVAGEDGAAISLNGKPYPRLTSKGRLRIPRLPVSNYVVGVSKDGYERPPEQSVSIRKGEEGRLEFSLRPMPKLAALHIRGAAQGTNVLLDQNSLGVVQPDGSFSKSGVTPGDHTIELRRDKHEPRRLQKNFRAGETLELADAEVALQRIPGKVRLLLSPPDSTVTVRQASEKQGRVLKDNPLVLAEGSYVITASAPEHTPSSAPIQVVAGEIIDVDLKLAKTAPIVVHMEGWEEPGGWTKEGAWLVHKGGNFVPFRRSPAAGVFVFTATVLKGKQIQWAVNHTDARNYALFQIDKTNFYRKQVSNGQTRELAKTKHGLDKESYFTIGVDVKSGTVIHRIQRKGVWAVLDVWNRTDGDFAAGKFGFMIPENDHVGISNFSFTP